jgi:hypothetical protein
MFGRLTSYSYANVVEKYHRHALYGGAALGAGYYSLRPHTRVNTMSDTIFGAAFSLGVGGLAGLGALSLHPLVIGGIVVGVPTYMLQRVYAPTAQMKNQSNSGA